MYNQETIRIRELLDSALSVLRYPIMHRSLNKWCEYQEERNYANSLLRKSLKMLKHGATQLAFDTWREEAAMERRRTGVPNPSNPGPCEVLARSFKCLSPP